VRPFKILVLVLLDDLPFRLKGLEPVPIQALVSESALEALKEGMGP
jgi:hypothetical protein